jgi:U1 small nuclear ribonucleoprotein C
MSVRKAHNSGRNHLRNVIDYYQRTAPPYTIYEETRKLTRKTEIGHEKAQSVIDSITSSYADAGQAASNPMLQQPMGPMPGGFGGPPPPFGFPGKFVHSSFSLAYNLSLELC